MSGSELSDVLLALIRRHMPSMDHVAVLLALRAAPAKHHKTPELARDVRLDPAVVAQVERDLLASQLIQREGDGVRYAPADDTRAAVDQLADMYHTKPVTLVRALYDRPVRSVQSFADAFRLRTGGD